jgi:hypothetical protein
VIGDFRGADSSKSMWWDSCDDHPAYPVVIARQPGHSTRSCKHKYLGVMLRTVEHPILSEVGQSDTGRFVITCRARFRYCPLPLTDRSVRAGNDDHEPSSSREVVTIGPNRDPAGAPAAVPTAGVRWH